MATVTVTKGYNNPTGWISGEEVNPEKLNQAQTPVVSLSGIVNADVDAAAAIAASKLNLANAIGATQLSAGAVETAKIADDAVTNAKLSLSANDGEIKKAINSDNSPPIFACRAWVNFDGTKDTTGAASTANTNRLIRGSGNVASVLRNSAGNYTITFTTAMPDENGCVVTAAGDSEQEAVLYTSSQTNSSITVVNAVKNSYFPTEVTFGHVAIFR